MEDCIFCKIVNHEIPASIVYEDNKAMAFMTIEAINTGHLLVIPNQHVPHVHEMDEALHAHVMQITRRLSHAVEAAFSPKKVGLMVSGWEVPHAHVHVVPMAVPTDVASKKLLDHEGLHPTNQELDAHAEQIRSKLEIS